MHSAASPSDEVGERRRPFVVDMLRRWVWPVVLMLPLAAYCIGFLLPLSLMAGFAFMPYSNATGFGSPSLQTFTEVVINQQILQALFFTANLSLAVVVASAAMAYPLGLLFMGSGRQVRLLILIVVLAPLLINAVVRTFGWYIFFSAGGLFESMFGIGLQGSTAAVWVALTHQYYAYMVISLLVSLSNIPREIVPAARTLGASNFLIFRRIIFPYSVPGLIAGGVIVFGLSAGAIVAPLLIGGGTMNLLTIHIYRAMLVFFDPQRGMALGTLLLTLNIAVVIFSEQFVRRMKDRARAVAKRATA